MKADDFRRIALSMQGAIESAHMRHPDFRAHGRIFATISEDNRKGMVVLTPEQQAECLGDHAGMFEPANGAWGRQGCTMVLLASADEETVGEAMTLAWQNSANAAARRASGSRKKTAAKPRRATSAPATRRRRRATR